MATSERKRVMKIFLSDDEADRIRLAAAITRQTIGEFVHDAVVREALRLTSKIELLPEGAKRR